MFRRIFGSNHERAADQAETALTTAATTAGDTATVRRIVAKLEAMPAEQARFIASAAYTLARAANADMDISADETAAIETALQTQGSIDEATAVLVTEMAKLQAQDGRRDRGLRRDPRVPQPRDHGAAARHPARVLPDRGGQRDHLGRGERRGRRDRPRTGPGPGHGQRDPCRIPRAAVGRPGGPPAGRSGLRRRAQAWARRSSTRPSPRRRRTSASNSAS